MHGHSHGPMHGEGACPFPAKVVHEGRSVHLEPLAPHHATALWQAAHGGDASWRFLRYGPFASESEMAAFVQGLSERTDQPFWAVLPAQLGRAVGWLSLCDVYPADDAMEIGSIWYSPQLQRSRAATEAIFLLLRHAFDDLGYQRLVWRCAAQNLASRQAADRYGFQFEGIWRSAFVIKGEHRDVAWHSILRAEWPARRNAIAAWLDDANFDDRGEALCRLKR